MNGSRYVYTHNAEFLPTNSYISMLATPSFERCLGMCKELSFLLFTPHKDPSEFGWSYLIPIWLMWKLKLRRPTFISCSYKMTNSWIQLPDSEFSPLFHQLGANWAELHGDPPLGRSLNRGRKSAAWKLRLSFSLTFWGWVSGALMPQDSDWQDYQLSTFG